MTAACSADSGRRIMSFAGFVEHFLLFPPLCVSSKSALQSLCYGFRKIRKDFFLDFLEEEFSRGFDIRILRVSISLGTKFQRNRLGCIWAQAGLRNGVGVSAISSVQNV